MTLHMLQAIREFLDRRTYPGYGIDTREQPYRRATDFGDSGNGLENSRTGGRETGIAGIYPRPVGGGRAESVETNCGNEQPGKGAHPWRRRALIALGCPVTLTHRALRWLSKGDEALGEFRRRIEELEYRIGWIEKKVNKENDRSDSDADS